MANQEHMNVLTQGMQGWNAWRKAHRSVEPDLSEAKLSGANLREADLNWAKLSGANLNGAKLWEADLRWAHLVGAHLDGADLRRADLGGAHLDGADLRWADLSGAYLIKADLNGAHLSEADLRRTHLFRADLSEADLTGADLSGARCGYTIFANIDLQTVNGLEGILHGGPSEISISTLYRSQGTIPEAFLRGAGVPDSMIEYARSLTSKAIKHYNCFISYATTDEALARQLYTDLQRNGVRCWFAPEDMKTGDKIRHRIDESIQLYDKLLLLLSEHSVASQWVEHEVETALGKELEGNPPILFPIHLDGAVMQSKTGWASHIRLNRHITDFTCWKEHNAYQLAFTQLLHDLKAEPG